MDTVLPSRFPAPANPPAASTDPSVLRRRRLRRMAQAGALVALVLTVTAFWDLGVWIRNRPAASTQALAKPLQPFEVDPSWIRSGQPNFRATLYAVSPDQHTYSGIWACDGPSTFEWHFSMDETVHILEGRVEIDYQGQHFVLEPGQSAHFQAGTTAVWHVPQHLKKSFTLFKPQRLGWLLGRLGLI